MFSKSSRIYLWALFIFFMANWNASAAPDEEVIRHKIDLLGLIDLERDRLSGNWSFKDNGLWMEGAHRPKLVLPLSPQVSYELHIDFTIETNYQFGVTLPLNPGMTRFWVMAAHKGGGDVLSLDMHEEAAPYIVKKAPSCGLAGSRKSMTIRVELEDRNSRIQVVLDDERVLDWKGPKASLFASKEYAMPSESLGLTNWGTTVMFHKLNLVLLPGEVKDEHVVKQEQAGTYEHDEQRLGEVPPGFRFQGQETFTSGERTNTVKVFVHEKTGLEFVLVPGGAFAMGSSSDAAYQNPNEHPAHRVILMPFLLCRTECTQEAWDRIGGYDIRQWKESTLPIDRVDWDGCTEWCSKTGLRLPTEAEWEYACRAGTSTSFYYGNSHAGIGEYAWYLRNSDGRTHPVGETKPNAFGLYDMYGNLWEWCQDSWHEHFAEAPDDGGAWESPDSAIRVARGGSWESHAYYCRSAMRGGFRPGLNDSSIGFRPAASLRNN